MEARSLGYGLNSVLFCLFFFNVSLFSLIFFVTSAQQHFQFYDDSEREECAWVWSFHREKIKLILWLRRWMKWWAKSQLVSRIIKKNEFLANSPQWNINQILFYFIIGIISNVSVILIFVLFVRILPFLKTCICAWLLYSFFFL